MKWVCTVCGYVHEGSQPPEVCPLCGVGPELFEAAEKPAEEESAGFSGRVLILGGGIAGVTAAEAVRKLSDTCEIVLASAEAILPYHRMNLTRFLAGEVEQDDLVLQPESWYEAQRISLKLSSIAKGIDLAAHTVRFADESTLEYDKLILCLGASPFVPPIAGAEGEGVMTLRTKDDALKLLELARSGVRMLAIGGGLLGLETAGGLSKHGAQVTILHKEDWIMNRQLSQETAAKLKALLEERGMTVVENVNTQSVLKENGQVQGVELTDGSKLEGEVVVITAGVRPNLELACEAGLNVHRGIVVNQHMQTSDPDVYAAGDVAEYNGDLYGLWFPAIRQAQCAASNAVGEEAEVPTLTHNTALKVLGVNVNAL